MVQVRREAILAKARRSYGQPAIDAWAAETTPDRTERYRQQSTDPQFIVLVAEFGDEIVGFATAVPANRELSALYVKQNAIGQVGRALLAQLEQRAFLTADALTCAAALNAVPFYEANGYAQHESVAYVDGSGTRVPCVRMKKVRPSATPAR